MDDIVNLKKNKFRKRLKLWSPLVIGAVLGILIFALDILPAYYLQDASGWVIIQVLLVVTLATVASIIVAVTVHELGHLFFGLVTGYSFSSFSVGPFNWYKQDGRIRFTFSPKPVVGQCLMAPPKNKQNFEFILYNLGGVIFGVVPCLVLWIAILISDHSFLVLIGLGVALLLNIVVVISNALPITSAEAPTDGANIREALQSKEAIHAFYIQLYINHEISTGKRFSDFDYKKEIKVKDDADVSNYLVAWTVLAEADYWLDCGNTEKALELWNRIDIEALPPAYRRAVNLDLLYYYTCHAPDAEKAKEIYEKDGIKLMLSLPLPTSLRYRAAYEFFVLGEKDTGREMLAKAKAAAYNLPSKGIHIMEMDYLSTLGALMNETENKIVNPHN